MQQEAGCNDVATKGRLRACYMFNVFFSDPRNGSSELLRVLGFCIDWIEFIAVCHPG